MLLITNNINCHTKLKYSIDSRVRLVCCAEQAGIRINTEASLPKHRAKSFTQTGEFNWKRPEEFQTFRSLKAS